MNNCWDNDQLKLERTKEDDVIWFIKKIFIDSNYHKVSKILSYIFLIIHVSLWTAQYYDFFQSIDVALMIQYGPCSLVMLFAFSSICILYTVEDFVKKACAEIKTLSWTIKSCSYASQQRITKVAKIAIYATKLNLVLSLLMFLALLMRLHAHKEWEVFYQVTFLQKHFPNHGYVLSLIFYISMGYFVIPMLSPLYILQYVTLHVYFQYFMLLERIPMITENYGVQLELVYDDLYQQQVFQRLRFVIRRLMELRIYSIDCASKLPVVIAIYFVLTFALIFSYVSFWYLDPDPFYPLIFMLGLVSCNIVLVATENGTMTENEQEQLYKTLLSLPWYTFDKRNQIIFLFFADCLRTPFSLSPYKTLPISRTVIVLLYKVFSSASALLAQSIHRK